VTAGEAARPLLVYAPGSIAPFQKAIRDGFHAEDAGCDVRFCQPAYSGLLAAQILNGAPADVFISANRRYIEELRTAGLVVAPRAIAGNRLCLIVRADRVGEIAVTADLTRDNVRLLIPPAESDPLGAYVEELFAQLGLTEAFERKRRRGEIADDLRALPERLATGTVDAALVYATSAPQLAPSGVAVALSPAENMSGRIVFTAGAVRRAGAQHPAADRFVAYLAEGPGQTLLVQAGFLPAEVALGAATHP
jgi:molybdate transport system substrate-binding protein